VADPGGAPRLSQSWVRPLHFVYDCADHRFWRRAENHAHPFGTIYYFANRQECAAVGSERVLKKTKNAPIFLSALGKKIMKVTTLILALLALALATGTAMVTSIQMQPVAACGGPNC
jgi:hypothetical protein